MNIRVVRAFFHSGGLKAGTPSEIASTPVSAVHPEAKARASRKAPASPVVVKPSRGSGPA